MDVLATRQSKGEGLMRLLLNTSIIGLSLVAFALTGCGGDELGGVFIPDEIPDEEENLGPKYPVEVGDRFGIESMPRTSAPASKTSRD